MKQFWIFSGVILLLFLALFGLAQTLGLDFMEQVAQMREAWLPLAALLGVGLLAGDIVLPVPSSLVMITLGSLFGLVGGALLAFLGGVLAALLGYYLGKMGRDRFQKWWGAVAIQQGEKLFQRFGLLAVIISRPVPLLSETVSVMAGSARFRFDKMLFGSILGVLPASVIYAWAGSSLNTGQYGAWPFLIVLGLAGILFLIGHFKEKKDTVNPTNK